ncbi:MAG: hypothetical protein FWD62_12580 [Betaproteobacteria bacterium]|nr:hypothetical protein [Betaproteobacteria bacterium]
MKKIFVIAVLSVASISMAQAAAVNKNSPGYKEAYNCAMEALQSDPYYVTAKGSNFSAACVGNSRDPDKEDLQAWKDAKQDYLKRTKVSKNVGQCVYPKTKFGANGRLVYTRTIYIFDNPSASAPKHEMTAFSSFSIKAEADGGFVQLVTVPDYDLPNPDSVAGKVVGWVKLSDFDFQALRNCN